MSIDPFTDDPFTDDPLTGAKPKTSLSAMTDALASLLEDPAPESENETGRVDQVAVRKSGGFVFLTPREWSAIDAEHRMEAIKSNRVIFLSDDRPVSTRAALTWLKANPTGGQ